MIIKSIAIGSFDGIHIAHKELIKRADGVLVIEKGFASLTPGYKRAFYTNKPTSFYLFDEIKKLSPKEFIDKLKNEFPKLDKIIVGYDFVFGKNRSGNSQTLKELFKSVEIVPEVKIENISVHSRVIREALNNSDIKLANKLLGRNYKIDGFHIKGQGLGSKELVPTINLQTYNYTLPHGVFAIKAYINDTPYNAVCFIGHRNTVDKSFALEVHILEKFNENIKGNVWVEFISFIRKNQKFSNLKELKEQIFKDIEIAREVLL